MRTEYIDLDGNQVQEEQARENHAFFNAFSRHIDMEHMEVMGAVSSYTVFNADAGEEQVEVKRLFRLVLSKANVQIGMYRSMLMAAGKDTMPEPGIDDLQKRGEWLLLTRVYPSLVACVVEHQGFEYWPPTFKDYLGMDEIPAFEWEIAAWELNPQWSPRKAAVMPADQQKKMPLP